jgi:Arc/MetJ-type ribon-helix-helix transcriptional regulator
VEVNEPVITRKVQLDEKDLEFIEEACSILKYRSKSQYMRDAILEKIRADKRRLRALKCREAMEAYGECGPENIFEAIEVEDFEDR